MKSRQSARRQPLEAAAPEAVAPAPEVAREVAEAQEEQRVPAGLESCSACAGSQPVCAEAASAPLPAQGGLPARVA